MPAWVVSEITPKGSMELRDIAQPAISADECLVCVEAAGINFLNTLMMRGLYRVQPALVERTFCEIFDLYAADVPRPLVRDVFPLEQADRALAAISTRETVGKVAILMGEAP